MFPSPLVLVVVLESERQGTAMSHQHRIEDDDETVVEVVNADTTAVWSHLTSRGNPTDGRGGTVARGGTKRRGEQGAWPGTDGKAESLTAEPWGGESPPVDGLAGMILS